MTRRFVSSWGKCSDFNPHPHTEDDDGITSKETQAVHFNPHPHTEDDGKNAHCSHFLKNFNPHPHTEDDAPTQAVDVAVQQFQSTSSHGGWLLHLVYLIPKYSIYRTWCNFIQMICWKSLSISTTCYLFECESLHDISDTCNSHLPMY